LTDSTVTRGHNLFKKIEALVGKAFDGRFAGPYV